MLLIGDTETTGLIANRLIPASRQPEIIELYLALVDLDGDEPVVLEELDMMIRPTKPIPPFITKITRISDMMVADAETFSQVADTVAAFLAKAKTLIFHNATFDAEMLEIEFDRLGRPGVVDHELVCTVENSVHYRGRRLSLGILHEHLFGEKFKGAHRAKTDVAALIRCAHAMKQKGDL